MQPLDAAVARAVGLATPAEPIEVSLAEAVGLVLAEPAIADVDLPPFDRASASGFAVRAADAVVGALLRVASPWSDDGHEIDPGEAARVEAGAAMPVGADAVLDPDAVRADPLDGPPRVVEILRRARPGRSVARRGTTLAAGSVLLPAGTRLRPSMVPLLASQGCVHPVCHRRVRAAIVAVGDHLIGPAESPVLHRERNAANLAVGSLLLGASAMTHDLGSISAAEFPRALDRALNAHVVLILGRLDGEAKRALAKAGAEPSLAGIALEPGGAEVGHAVVREAEGGPVACHVVHLPLDPIEAVVATSLFVLPLVARLQGEVGPTSSLVVAWDGLALADGDRPRAVPAILKVDDGGCLVARSAAGQGPADLPDLARADGLALIGPGPGNATARFVPFGGWPGWVGP